MRYLSVLLGTHPTTPPPPAFLAGLGKLMEDTTRAGVLLDTAGLGDDARRLTLAGGQISITDGPFAETKELLSYAMYDVRSIEEGVEWSRRFLQLHVDTWPEIELEARIFPVFGPGE